MLSPIEELAQMEERKRDLLRTARLNELYRQADEKRPQIGDRFMTLVGDLMITSGQKLKARSSSASSTSPQTAGAQTFYSK